MKMSSRQEYFEKRSMTKSSNNEEGPQPKPKRKLRIPSKHPNPEAVILQPDNMIKSFEGLLDVISESYFGIVESGSETSKKKKGRFQFSTLDLLVSPLRQDIQFGSGLTRTMEH